MKYAVVNIAGKQYKVEEGQELLVDHLASKDGKVTLDNVLLVVDGDKVNVGNPKLDGAKVEIQVQGEEKGDKIRVLKYKSKSRYRKVRGFRALHSKIKITKISG